VDEPPTALFCAGVRLPSPIGRSRRTMNGSTNW
jgi:hypothetical protein